MDADGCGASFCGPLWVGMTDASVVSSSPAIVDGVLYIGSGHRFFADTGRQAVRLRPSGSDLAPAGPVVQPDARSAFPCKLGGSSARRTFVRCVVYGRSRSGS